MRSRAHYETGDGQIPGSIRVPPDQVTKWATNRTNERAIVTYCTCPDDASSARGARQLIAMGFTAAALKGGYLAWHDKFPVVPKESPVASTPSR
jgi:rhodanese-related sulfurtransferase